MWKASRHNSRPCFSPGLQTARARTLMMLGLVPIYSLCFVGIKAGLPFAPPLRFAGLRLLLAGMSLLGLALLVRHLVLLPRTCWPWLIAIALSAGTTGYGAMFLSPGRAGAGIASVLGNLQPLVVMLLAVPLLGERLTWSKALALLLGLLGVILISATLLASSNGYGFSGALLAIASSAGFAVGSVIVKQKAAEWSALSVTAWQFIIGSLPLLAVSAITERTAEVSWTGEFVGLLLFLALVGSAFTTAVWYWLVQHDEVSRLALFLFLVPAFGVLFAALFFGERVSVPGGLGIGLTIAGIGAALWGSREPAGAAPAPDQAPQESLPIDSQE